MPITTLNMENFNPSIEDNDILIVDFWASWCGPCMAFKPIFEQTAEKHPEIAFASCNTEEESDLAHLFQIRSIPTLMVFREQILVYAQPGMVPAEALEELIEKVKALDMDEIRKEVAQMKEQAASA